MSVTQAAHGAQRPPAGGSAEMSVTQAAHGAQRPPAGGLRR
jgi:hypothetical protein